MKVEGVFTPTITPFTKDGEIFVEGIREFTGFLIEKGIKGFYINGSYGLGPVMTIKERKKSAEAFIENAKGKVTTIVHVGSPSLDATIELAKHAEDIGADAVASVPPFYYKYKEENIKLYFEKLVSSVNIPVFAYNNPATTGNTITPMLLKELAEIGVVGVKDSSFNIVMFWEFIDTIKYVKRDFIFIIGTEALMLPAIMAGASACISGLSNVFPELNVELYNLIKKGEYRKAVEKQLTVVKARKIIHSVSTYPACYSVLKIRGIDVGYPKPPFKPITKEQVENIVSEFKKLGLL